MPDAKRFTREVMTAWAAVSVHADAERLAAELVEDAPQAPFEIVWIHQGDSVQIEVREKSEEAESARPPGPPPGRHVQLLASDQVGRLELAGR